MCPVPREVKNFSAPITNSLSAFSSNNYLAPMTPLALMDCQAYTTFKRMFQD